MPFTLFDYNPGSFHTMGESPAGGMYNRLTDGSTDALCRNGGDIDKCSLYWAVNGCSVKGTTDSYTVTCPPKQTQGGTGPLCNPSSVGKRFSFNFPSGKKWTLSQKDDASARRFYCGGGPTTIPGVPVNPAQPYIPTGPGKCPDGSDAFSVRGTWKCPSGEGGSCGGIGGDRCGSGLECDYGGLLGGVADARGTCRLIKSSTGGSAGSECPNAAINEGLIQQAKMLGDGNAYQVRHGSSNIPLPEQEYATYKNCPIYQQLLSAYYKAYNETLKFLPIGLTPG